MLVTDLYIWSAVRFTLTRDRALVNLHWLLLSVLLSASPFQKEGANTLLEVVVSALEKIFRLYRTHAQRKMLPIWLQNPQIQKDLAFVFLKMKSSC